MMANAKGKLKSDVTKRINYDTAQHFCEAKVVKLDLSAVEMMVKVADMIDGRCLLIQSSENTKVNVKNELIRHINILQVIMKAKHQRFHNS